MFDAIYRQHSRQVFATLVRLLRDFDLAEEAMHEAFTVAIERWETEGTPQNPVAWLVAVGRAKAIDGLRRQTRFQGRLEEVAARCERLNNANQSKAEEEIEDDRLRLIFVCCHPAIDAAIQIALTLREVCGLTTDEIANAFLVSPSAMAQRLVRGKSKIRDAGIPFNIPSADELPERLESVLAVLYLVFTEGYSASSGTELVRSELSSEAIRLGKLLLKLLPHPEVMGLLALLLLQESRRKARTAPNGDLILLEDQDRSLWDTQLIEEGRRLVARAVSTRRFGSYTIQAAIAAEHAKANSLAETDWKQITALYGALYACQPSPIIELNRSVAIAMSNGIEAGLEIVEAIHGRGELQDYHLLHATRADFLRRLGRYQESRAAYTVAIRLAKQEPEKRFLQQRLDGLPHVVG